VPVNSWPRTSTGTLFTSLLHAFRWTLNVRMGRMLDVTAASISVPYARGRSARVGRQRGDVCLRTPRAARLRRLLLLAIGAYLCSGFSLWAQTSDSQTADANKSWTATTESQSDNANSTRTIESHTQSGNHMLDSQSIQQRGSNGDFELYRDVEKETVQVDATTVRTTTRTFVRDADGAKTLAQIVEEEKHIQAGGDSNLVRSTSNPDANGKLQVVRREVEETKKTSKNVEEIKTIVLIPSVNGGLVPAVKVQERREQGENRTVESQETTLLPDGSGNWQTSKIRRTTTTQDGENRSREERVSRPDSEGKLGIVSRTVSNESASGPGEAQNTVETYSVDIPGSTPDGSLHLVERTITSQRAGSTGQKTAEQKVEQANPGDPGSRLRVTILTTDTLRPGPSGAQATRTVQARDANGSFGVVSVDTTKSDNIHAIQVQIAPSEKPK
jgi:hypothetical protein